MVAFGFALMPASTDIMVVSLPGISRHFGIGTAEAQAALSVFVIAFGVSQLVYGPLTDRFGRRPTLIAGSAIFLAASVACMLAPTIEALIAARFFQAIGCCAWSVAGRALVRDVHGEAGTARMMGYINTGTSLLIFSGPILGGLLEQHFGWRANFAFFMLYGGTLMLAAMLLLDETHRQRDPRATRIRPMLANYAALITDRRYLGNAICMMCMYGCIMAYLSGAPFVLMGTYGLSAWEFGLLFALSSAGYIAGSMITAKKVMRVGAERLLTVGAGILLLSGVTLAAVAFAGLHSVAAVVVAYFFVLVATGLIQPSALAGAIGPFPRMAGTASALAGFLQLAAGSLVGLAVARLHDGSAVPMATAILLCSIALNVTFYRLVKRPPILVASPS
jgi:DHA1 family bicyclomycin/chloramphenicol resistance-like MFS transporter